MCAQCDETVARVAALTGVDAATVKLVHDAIADDLDRTRGEDAAVTEAALSALLGGEVRPYLLGSQPAVLVTVEEGPFEDGRVVVGVGHYGGVGHAEVLPLLKAATDSWALHGTGGVLADGTLVEWLGKDGQP